MGFEIFMIIGGAMLIAAILLYLRTTRLISQREKTIATVVEVRRSSGYKGGKTYKPTFRFETYDGKEYFHKYPVGTNPSSWKVGDENEIIYDPNDPNKAMLNTFFGKYGLTFLFGFMGATFFISGYFVVYHT